jgi:hypothetical protein
MHASIHRPLAFAILALGSLLSAPALAQSAADRDEASQSQAEAANTRADEEITVRGRKTLQQYRLELEQAREQIIEAYNEANSSNRNDITCRNERPTGSRMPQRVCRSNAQREAEAAAASSFLYSMFTSAGNFMSPEGAPPLPGGPQVNAEVGAATARIDEFGGRGMSRTEIDEELQRLKKENRRVYRAVVRYMELQDEYDRAREGAGR